MTFIYGFLLGERNVLYVMIVHALLCNLFLYKLFMHACVVAQSTLCTLSVLLSSLLNNPPE